MEDGRMEGGGEAEEVEEEGNFESFSMGGGGETAKSASFFGGEELLD